MNWKHASKLSAGLWLLHAIVFIALVHVWKGHLVWQADLSEDKRYTVSPSTRQLLKGLDEDLYLEVYLAGTLPPNFQRLRKSLQEMLETMSQHSQGALRYVFVDPAQAHSAQNRERYYLQLARKGIQPTHLSYRRDGNTSTQVIFPGALLAYKGQEKSVMLLRGQQGQNAESMLQSSIESIEYHLAEAIQALLRPPRTLGIFADTHMDSLRMWGLQQALREKYNLVPLALDKPVLGTGIEVLLMLKPQDMLRPRDIYHLDQFIMHGGRVLFFLDALHVAMDSLSDQGTLALPYAHGLDELLFRYGIRMRPELVADLQCLPYPVITGMLGDKPQMNMLPWSYFPRITHFSDHPVVRNLDAVMLRFAGALDTVRAPGIRKRPLFFTSPYSRSYAAPWPVSLNELRQPPDQTLFRSGPQAMAYALEGSFRSLYAHRLPPKDATPSHLKPQGTPTRLIVVGDGDFVLNDLHPQNQEPLELGVYWPERAIYAHKDFLWQALEYLFDDEGIILTRNKRFLIRPLDKIRVREERVQWQLLNMAGPWLLIGLVGGLRFLYRKRRWGHGHKKHPTGKAS